MALWATTPCVFGTLEFSCQLCDTYNISKYNPIVLGFLTRSFRGQSVLAQHVNLNNNNALLFFRVSVICTNSAVLCLEQDDVGDADTEDVETQTSQPNIEKSTSGGDLGARDSPQRGSGGSRSSRKGSLCRESPGRRPIGSISFCGCPCTCHASCPRCSTCALDNNNGHAIHGHRISSSASISSNVGTPIHGCGSESGGLPLSSSQMIRLCPGRSSDSKLLAQQRESSASASYLNRDSPGRWSSGRAKKLRTRQQHLQQPLQPRSRGGSVSMYFPAKESPLSSMAETNGNTATAQRPIPSSASTDRCNNNSEPVTDYTGEEVCLGCRGDCNDPTCPNRRERLQSISQHDDNETDDCNLNKVQFLKTSKSYQEALKCALRSPAAEEEPETGWEAGQTNTNNNGSRRLPPAAATRYREACVEFDRLGNSDLHHRHGSDDSWTSTSSDDESDQDMVQATAGAAGAGKPGSIAHIVGGVVAASMGEAAGIIAGRQSLSSEEENTSERSRPRVTPDPAMISSGSTMASSLERSLELAAMHSDGLSDKERKVRQVKNVILGHRRTFSVSLSPLGLRDERVDRASCHFRIQVTRSPFRLWPRPLRPRPRAVEQNPKNKRLSYNRSSLSLFLGSYLNALKS